MAPIPSSTRTMTYAPVASAGPFPVDFPVFDEDGVDLKVTVDAIARTDWTFVGTLESGFYGAPNTWINGEVTFDAPITGALVIKGRRAPRRQAQYAEGRGIPARDHNTEYNLLTAVDQELRRDIDDYGDRLDDLDEAVNLAQGAADLSEAAADVSIAASAVAVDAASSLVALTVGTRADLAAAAIPAIVKSLRTNGYAVAGDGGGASYRYVSSEPPHAGKVQSADGAWWEITDPLLNALMFGCDRTGGTITATQVQAAVSTSAAVGRPCLFPAGSYLLADSRIRVGSNAAIVGEGRDRTVFVRDTDSAQGTIEVFGASNVVLRGFQISYTPGTYTLGYPQTGICIRSGSSNVLVEDVLVMGKVNRQFQIINASDVVLRRCYGVGGGNAGLRIVSDNGANVYSGFTDESTTWGPSRNIWVDECVFSGATTLEGTTRAGTSYGVNLATEAGGSDMLEHVFVTNSRVRYTNLQGFQASGKAQNIHFGACHAGFVQDGAGSGIGFLAQIYSTNYLQRSSFVDCKAEFCEIGHWALDALYVDFIGGKAWGCTDGGRQSNGAYILWLGFDFSANAGFGLRLLGTAQYSRVIGGNAVLNATGIYFDGGTTNCVYDANVSYANSVANYGINGTGHTNGNK